MSKNRTKLLYTQKYILKKIAELKKKKSSRTRTNQGALNISLETKQFLHILIFIKTSPKLTTYNFISWGGCLMEIFRNFTPQKIFTKFILSNQFIQKIYFEPPYKIKSRSRCAHSLYLHTRIKSIFTYSNKIHYSTINTFFLQSIHSLNVRTHIYLQIIQCKKRKIIDMLMIVVWMNNSYIICIRISQSEYYNGK
eukprot:TRINITY_DN904_c0_g1_i14.p2 TRINITY_DN904_c0_g1~~TRINITY_DN904_c0_g1_i14.p2  ORF type:complete len:195 (-),score=-24.04 TRINITY_DN904_c0_g1_i14:279-863(-)